MYWDRKVHDGFQISSRDVTRGEHNGTTGGHEITKKMFQSSMRGISDDEQSSSISRNGSTYQNIWIDNMASSASGKVVVETECECMTDKVRAINVRKLPTGDRWLFPPITLDPECSGHYMTLQQLSRTSIQQP